MFNVTIPSLDQLKILVAVVDTGSFSAAAKVLHRSQPVVSYAIANLEAQLGVTLFERRGQRPVLTDAGKTVLSYARRISLVTDEMRAGVTGLIQGVESEVSIAVDVLFATETLATALKAFSVQYPSVALKVRMDALGGVEQLIMDGMCRIGISGIVRKWPDQIEALDFGTLQIVPVAAPEHPLAAHGGQIPVSILREHVQLALSDRTNLTEHDDLAISGIRTWRISDLGAKHALLRTGIGWGYMPEHMVGDDLKSGRLVRLSLNARKGGSLPYTMIHRVDAPPGPAGQWLCEKLISIA